MKFRIHLFIIGLILCYSSSLYGQSKNKKVTHPAVPIASATNTTSAQGIDVKLYQGLKWRNIGPFRGGRANAICGVPGQEMVFYAGYTGGGVWKTEDGGQNWFNISDGFFTTNTIGDIAVADSDPNVIYVGSGEHAVRGVMTTFGDGVYKSVDAGKTWKNIGLEKTRHISDVLIDPRNHDIVFVGAQGPLHGPGTERGVFKTTDGGSTWKKTLYIDENTGISSLVMDKNNTRVLYAATWQHRRYPWKVESGGPGSSVYKSVDAGETWKKIVTGLPAEMGKIGLSVAQSDPNRIYALVEAEKSKSGMYRSDDGGANWALMSNNQTITARSWYYMEVFADPTNENVVYALNAPLMRSIDGGKTFEDMRVIHGDCHDLWLHPAKNNIIAMAEDGGATISYNKGKSWSTFNNQPTAQFYRITADKQIPFWVYGGQQDNLSVAIPSQTPDYGILSRHWFNGPGCESATVALDDYTNPRILYGGCYNGRIGLLDKMTMQMKEIQPYPMTNLGYQAKNMKYRFNWNAPLINSPHDARIIYYGGNVLFKTADGGLSWTIISPDLTRDDENKQLDGGGPFTNEGAGGENYNTIYSVAESIHEKNTIYTGSDCGLVHITRDGGQTWKNITPPGLPECSIHSLEASPHDRSTIYIAANRYKFNDFANYAYKSTDYGTTWKKIGEDIERDDFFKVIKEDLKVPGILYAGAERGLYISFDGGTTFTKFQLNLPIVPITDLAIRDNSLAASTAGRSFWVLDDLSALQQSKAVAKNFQLYTPKPQYRIPGPPPFTLITEHGFGQNPTEGIAINYFIEDTSSNNTLSLEIQNANGDIIRKYSGKKSLAKFGTEGGRGNLEAPNVDTPLIVKGMNTFYWDLRTQGLEKSKDFIQEADYRGYKVAPGSYKARMTYGKETKEVEMVLLDLPTNKIPQELWDQQQAMLKSLTYKISEIQQKMKSAQEIKSQLDGIYERIKSEPNSEELKKASESLNTKLKDWQTQVVELRQKGFQDALNWPAGIISEFFFVRNNLDTYEPSIPKGYQDRIKDLEENWNSYEQQFDKIIETEAKPFNEKFRALNMPLLKVPEKKVIKP